VRSPRRRRPVAPSTLTLLWPLFRYSAIRDAYVLYYRATEQPPAENLAALLNQNRDAASAAALADLQACVERLTAAIDPELRAR